MNLHSLETIGLAIAVIVFITYRQSRWTSVRMDRLLRMPLIFALIGVVLLFQSVQHGFHAHLGFLDGVLIATELVLGLVGGWLMGRLTKIRDFGDGLRSRLSGPGIAVWLMFIAARIGLGAAAAVFHAAIVEQPATIFLVLAVVKTVQALIIRGRVDRHQIDQRRRAYAVSDF